MNKKINKQNKNNNKAKKGRGMIVDEDIRQNAIYFWFKYFDQETTTKIEQGINAWAINYANNHKTPQLVTAIYDDKQNDLQTNFLDPKNDHMRTVIFQEITNGKKKPEHLAYLEPKELNPNNWKQQLNAINATQEKLSEKNGVSLQKPCYCGKNMFSLHAEQTRAADEPMTRIYTCVFCGRKKRFGN